MMPVLDELLSPLLTTTWGRRLGLGLSIVMGILLVVTFSHTLLTLYNDSQLTRTHATRSDLSRDATLALSKQIAAIPAAHLFGEYGAERSARLPVTSLQIRLIGVIKSVPDKFSRVIISESNQPGRVYQTGDTLPATGVRIRAITPEGVVLDNGGRLEKLPLPRPPLMFQGMPKPLGE